MEAFNGRLMRNWPVLIIGTVLTVLLLRGAAPALLPLMRFLLIFFLIYFVIRTLKAMFFIKGAWDILNRRQQTANPTSHRSDGGAGTTIDLCPQCGDVLEPRHRCRRP